LLVPSALVGPNRLHEVHRAPIVEEEEPLTEAPERRGAEFIAIGLALPAVPDRWHQGLLSSKFLSPLSSNYAIMLSRHRASSSL
jgi:hypothetical protein